MAELKFDNVDGARQFVSVDFGRFVQYSAQLESYDVPPFHYKIAHWLAGDDVVAKTKVIMGFRLAAKTWMLRQYILWRWLRCPWMQMIIHSSTDKIAGRMTRAVLKALQENPLMEHLVPKGSVGTLEFNLNNVNPEQGMSLTCGGINTSFTSSRCDVYAFDDPEPDVDPESMTERIVNAYMEASNILHKPDRHRWRFNVERMPVPELTQLVVVGQPHCPGTAYFPNPDHVEEGEGHPLIHAKYLIIPIVTRGNEWTWPEIIQSKYYDYELDRPKTVAEVKSEFTVETWHCQQLIDPDYAAGYGSVLNLDEIEQQHRYLDHVVMAIDPADGDGMECEWGIALGGIFHGRKGHQIHVCYMGGLVGEAYGFLDEEVDFKNTDRFSTGENVWRKIFNLAEEFNVKRILLETNLVSARRACRRYMRKMGIHANVEEIHAKGRKERRITESLEQPVNNGMVSMNPGVMQDRANKKQLARMKYGKLPDPCDRIDALAILFKHLIEKSSLENTRGASSYSFAQASGQRQIISSFSRMGVAGRAIADR